MVVAKTPAPNDNFRVRQGAFTFSVDDIRRKLDRIAWRVSASGHFESPAGFGTRYSLARISCADSVAELLAILVESEC